MKKLYCILFLSLVINFTTFAQPFVPVSNPFPGLGRCAIAFADLDNDNDLDLIMSGQDNTYNAVTKIFVNNEGSFNIVDAGVRGVQNCALSLADYDHDGFIDFILTGQNYEGNKTYLYRNLGSLQFQLSDSTMFAAGSDGDVAFGDYDNDGFADIALSGNWSSKLYHNEGDGTFILTTVTLPGLNSPSLAWGDCDNDGDQDLVMVGDDGAPATYLMQNNNGEFTDMQTSVTGTIGGDVSWGDYDLDGYNDILISGKDTSLLPVSFIFRNKGNGNMINALAGFVGTALGPADFIDYDNDGDLDVMLAGQNSTCGTSFTRLYNNDGIGWYSEVLAGFAFAERSASAWGDYDNDGDYDLLLAGVSGVPVRFFYRNDLTSGSFQVNTPPTVPQIIDHFVLGSRAVLNWERATDNQSTELGLTYNLRVGTTPGGIDIVSPNADPLTGARYIAAPGNMSGNIFAILQNLAPGTYYYSIQAIDQSFAGSAFAPEQSFTILPTGISDPDDKQASDIIILKEPTGIKITGLKDEATVSIFTLTGSEIYNTTVSTSSDYIPTTVFPEGIYIIRIQTDSRCISEKIKF